MSAKTYRDLENDALTAACRWYAVKQELAEEGSERVAELLAEYEAKLCAAVEALLAPGSLVTPGGAA